LKKLQEKNQKLSRMQKEMAEKQNICEVRQCIIKNLVEHRDAKPTVASQINLLGKELRLFDNEDNKELQLLLPSFKIRNKME